MCGIFVKVALDRTQIENYSTVKVSNCRFEFAISAVAGGGSVGR
jgi:hypothetical protein